MKESFLLHSQAGKRLYEQAKELPIVDYHCHLSPKEIYEDQPFSNIAQMWLAGDHYKWRLMRAYGIPEECITGSAPDYDKFFSYAECIGLAAGNPLYHWTAMELSAYFHIDTPLTKETAPAIWQQANEVIRQEQLSPRKLITQSNVEWIVTTDDPVDSLDYHRQIAEDSSFSTRVTPAFRPDRLLNLRAKDWREYIHSLAQVAQVEITGMDGLERAICARLDWFCAQGCRLSDVGIEAFPSGQCTREEADGILCRALAGESLSDGEYRQFLFYMYVFLAVEYRNRSIVMQCHLAVKRNANTTLFGTVGADAGGDCVGDPVSQQDLTALLDAVDCTGGLPRTILYTLNPSMYPTMATAAGSFRNVTLGAAWWYNDHKNGIEEQLQVYSQVSHLGTFTGMLTDSRSFLSYTRHDYFRRILCGLLGRWIEAGELTETAAQELVYRVCYANSRALVVDSQRKGNAC